MLSGLKARAAGPTSNLSGCWNHGCSDTECYPALRPELLALHQTWRRMFPQPKAEAVGPESVHLMFELCIWMLKLWILMFDAWIWMFELDIGV